MPAIPSDPNRLPRLPELPGAQQPEATPPRTDLPADPVERRRVLVTGIKRDLDEIIGNLPAGSTGVEQVLRAISERVDDPEISIMVLEGLDRFTTESLKRIHRYGRPWG